MKKPDYIKKFGDLEIQEDIAFQQRSWRYQRIGQLAVILLVLAGAIGLFGGGVIGVRQQSDASGRLLIEHPRFMRADAAYEIRLEVSPRLVEHRELNLWIDRTILKNLQIETISPAPESVQLQAGRYLYRFSAEAGQELAPIAFYVRSRGMGSSRGRIGIVNGPDLAVGYFIYP